MISKLIKIIFGPPKLTDVEARVLEEVEAVMPSPLASILRRQKNQITKIQRLDHGREVDFYYAEKADESPCFVYKRDVFNLAYVSLASLDSGHEARVSVQIVKGRLFSLNFNAPPGDLRGERLRVGVELVSVNGEGTNE